MSKERKQIIETMKRREQDIRIMELLLKHKLTKKRAECKLQIMYYKACNVIAKAKLTMLGASDNYIRAPHILQSPHNITQMHQWFEQTEKRASNS
ncbi:MAG: hypothetical protein PVF15_08605 [Candidatus Bathyarchaeota archaeon]